MMINLEKNERENRVKSILYMAISFDDMVTVQKLLHPRGEFLGMSKSRFMYYLMDSKQFDHLGNLKNKDNEELMCESEYPFRYDEKISLDIYPGQRCFVISKKRIELITKYADEYNTITAEQIDELVGESFANRASLEKLHKSYYNKFKKAVGPKRAAQFVQYERFVDNAINTELNNNLPLIGELD